MPVTDDQFCAIAMAQQGVEEGAHAGHPEFHVGGEVFATLPKAGVGVLKLAPEAQVALMDLTQAAAPVAGDDGHKGWTQVTLSKAELPLIADYIGAAYRTVAPKRRIVL